MSSIFKKVDLSPLITERVPLEVRFKLLQKYINILVSRRVTNRPFDISFEQYIYVQNPRLFNPVYRHKQQATRCLYCKKPFNSHYPPTTDHFFPTSTFQQVGNVLVVCCQPCNYRKSNMSPKKFIEYIMLDAVGGSFSSLWIDHTHAITMIKTILELRREHLHLEKDLVVSYQNNIVLEPLPIPDYIVKKLEKTAYLLLKTM